MVQTLCLHNGRIYGLQGLQDHTAIVIENGIIRYIGNEEGLRSYIHDEIEIIDVGGRIIFPGFIDTHLHLTEWARQREYLPLGSFQSLKEVLEHIQTEAKGKSWIFGGGWNQNNWFEKRFPHRKDLDILGPDTKAIFYSKDIHSAWVNEAVIDLFPFEDVFNMLRKGNVKRDPDGQLTGILQEEALEVLLDPLLIQHPAVIFSDPRPYFKEFYKHGITSVHSMEYFNQYRDYLKLYQHEHHRGLRLGMYIYHVDSEKVYAQNLRFGSGGDWLRFYGIKLFTDGSLGSQTAWMREPYENAEHCGKKQMHDETLLKAITRAEAKGCALAIHALGDAAVEHVLDTLDKIDRDLRVPLRIEHAQILDKELIDRLKTKNLHLSVNPSHLPDDKAIAELHLGKRSRYAYAFRSMKIAGIPFAIGSDAPVEDIHPWKAIHAAVHRLGTGERRSWYPEENLRLSDAIQTYTYYGGMIAGMNEKKGILAPGYLGDCFVCSQDVFEEGLDDWKNIHSLLTVIGGRVVHNELETE
ncbi:MAG: amidohydrolase [Candidatus Marinimicrobia bacterium]|nr:amidohydrolase [Candidatus Neomarinimicrobiota bacterium]